MSHLSPCVFVLWAILTMTLCVFYFHHLWKFDRLRCLKLSRGPYNGAFRRAMTYSYLLAVPLLLTFSVGFAVIKYKEGYISLPSGAVYPKPYDSWTPEHRAALYPLTVIWGLSWGTEAVSHLEELCFWLFLIHAGPSPTSWFKSIYFKIWAGGSVGAMVLIPVVTVATKDDPLKNEAWVQFAGSMISLCITLGFLPILWVFPSFVQNVKNEGADTEAVTRLAKFHDLNITRIAFRFLFVLPILILSIDGILPHSHSLNESIMWTDFLSMASGVGCVVQSSITLMESLILDTIFFPRNVELETQRWLREPEVKLGQIGASKRFKRVSKASSEPSSLPDRDRPKYFLTDSSGHTNTDLSSTQYTAQPSLYPPASHLHYGDSPQHWDDSYSITLMDQQKQWHDEHSSAVGSTLGLTETNLRMHSELSPRVNPMAMSFTSPINISDIGWLDDPHHRGGAGV